MDKILNISKNPILIKNVSDRINTDIVCETISNLEYTNNQSNKISVDLNVFNNELLGDLGEVVKEESVDYLRNFWMHDPNFTFEDLQITQSWANISVKNEHHHCHEHPFSVVSGVIFLDDTVENLNLTFEMPCPEIPYWKGKTQYHVSLKDMVGLENNLQYHLVLFLSNTRHMVQTLQSENKRHSISFNTFWKGKVGDMDPSHLVYLEL